jgi:methionyl-tRNA formyltransferase
MTKIVFFGTEEFSAPSLRALIEAGYDIACVVTKPDTERGRGHHIESPLVAKIARESQIKVLQPEKLTGIADELRSFDVEIGVLVAYGKIIPQSVLDLFPRGIVNFHPSWLPIYRGPSPIETAIANGDAETGLTLISLTRRMDAGPIYYQEKAVLGDSETRLELYEQFAQRGAELLVEKLPAIISGELEPTAQDDAAATYCQMLTVADGCLNPAVMTAVQCERKVRAYLGWPKTRLDFHGREVIITKAKILDGFAGDDWPDVVPCADDTYLQILELVNPKSGKQMKTADYLRGLKA